MLPFVLNINWFAFWAVEIEFLGELFLIQVYSSSLVEVFGQLLIILEGSDSLVVVWLCRKGFDRRTAFEGHIKRVIILQSDSVVESILVLRVRKLFLGQIIHLLYVGITERRLEVFIQSCYWVLLCVFGILKVFG